MSRDLLHSQNNNQNNSFIFFLQNKTSQWCKFFFTRWISQQTHVVSGWRMHRHAGTFIHVSFDSLGTYRRKLGHAQRRVQRTFTDDAHVQRGSHSHSSASAKGTNVGNHLSETAAKKTTRRGADAGQGASDWPIRLQHPEQEPINTEV